LEKEGCRNVSSTAFIRTHSAGACL
jgi:hypothetical protein